MHFYFSMPAIVSWKLIRNSENIGLMHRLLDINGKRVPILLTIELEKGVLAGAAFKTLPCRVASAKIFFYTMVKDISTLSPFVSPMMIVVRYWHSFKAAIFNHSAMGHYCATGV